MGHEANGQCGFSLEQKTFNEPVHRMWQAREAVKRLIYPDYRALDWYKDSPDVPATTTDILSMIDYPGSEPHGLGPAGQDLCAFIDQHRA